MQLLIIFWMIACTVIGWHHFPYASIALLALAGALIELRTRMPALQRARTPSIRIAERFVEILLNNLLTVAGFYLFGYGMRYCTEHYL
jgi:hypothetical protein